jgi:hypothetical protein
VNTSNSKVKITVKEILSNPDKYDEDLVAEVTEKWNNLIREFIAQKHEALKTISSTELEKYLESEVAV